MSQTKRPSVRTGVMIILLSVTAGSIVATVFAFMASWIIGLIVLTIEYFVLGLVWRVVVGSGMRQQRLIKMGIEAEAVILSLREDGSSIQIGGALPKAGVQLELEVHPKNESKYQTSLKTYISVFELPKYIPGARLSVKYNPKKPDEVAIIGDQPMGFYEKTAPMSEIQAKEILEELKQQQSDLENRGLYKTARIKEAIDTGAVVNGDNPLLRLILEVEPDGLSSYETTIYAVVMRDSLYKTFPGNKVSLSVDPDSRVNAVLISLDGGKTQAPQKKLSYSDRKQGASKISGTEEKKKFRIKPNWIFMLVVAGIIAWNLFGGSFSPNKIEGTIVDAVLVPGENGQDLLFIVSDASFYYTSETQTSSEYSISTKTLFDKLYLYLYDPVKEKVLMKRKLKYDNVPSFNKLKFLNGRIWLLQDHYSEHNPQITIYDPYTMDVLSETQDFISGFTELSKGLASLYYIRSQLRIPLTTMDRQHFTFLWDIPYLQIKTRDGLNFSYFFEPDSLYDNYSQYEKYVISHDTITQHWFLLLDDKQPRNELYIVDGQLRNFDAYQSQYKDSVEAYSRMMWGSQKKEFSQQELLAIQGLKMFKASGNNIFLEGFKLYEDTSIVVILHQDAVGSGAKRLITCIDAEGRERWTLGEDDFFEELALDPDDSFSTAFFIKDNVRGLRSGNTFAISLKDVGVAGYEVSSGKKLWEIAN